jgi:hypothetical protein
MRPGQAGPPLLPAQAAVAVVPRRFVVLQQVVLHSPLDRVARIAIEVVG